MILYTTKATFEEYQLKMPQDLSHQNRIMAQRVLGRETGDKLMEWGVKLFYFDGRKCLQVVNFASKMTLFLFDIPLEEIAYVGDMIARILLLLYKKNAAMVRALKRMFEEHPFASYTRLTDRSIIATLNTTQRQFAWDGNRFYQYIRDGVLHSLDIDREVNYEYCFSWKVNGKREYFLAGEEFQKLVLARYSKQSFPPSTYRPLA